MQPLAPDAPRPVVDATSNEAASTTATPPVNPELVRAPELPAARRAGTNTLEILLFRGLSTPLALGLVVLQGRFLAPAGRGTFVLAVLTVSIFSRLLSQLGVAVATGTAGAAIVVAIGAATPSVGAETGAIAAAALVPNVLWQTCSGVLLGLGRIRPWNYVQLASPLLTVALTLLLVVGLDGGVHAALLAWTAAHYATAVLALALTRDVWSPFRLESIVDAPSRTLVSLALAMGALQVISLVGYRAELFVLESVR